MNSGRHDNSLTAKGWLLAALVSLVAALALPTVAFADTAVLEPPPTAAEPAAPTTGEEAPAPVDETAPTPVDETTPTTPPVETPADGGSVEAPAPPPSDVPGAVAPPAPADEVVPVPEVVAPDVTRTSPLPVTPDAPRLGEAIKVVPAVTAPVTPVTTPAAGTQVRTAAPDAPAAAPAPRVAEVAPAETEPPVFSTMQTSFSAPLERPELGPAAEAPKVPPVTTIGAQEPPEELAFAPTWTAPQGSAPPGASLLEVLAGYVLPGTGPPASTIIFLVLLGTLLAAIYAPRPQVSERIHLLGLLGPRSGHGLAVRRPG